MHSLYQVLKNRFGTQENIGKAFGISRQAVSLWARSGVPEHIAWRCHASADIPYVFNPSDYGVDAKGLNLNLKKVTTNDHKPERIQREAA